MAVSGEVEALISALVKHKPPVAANSVLIIFGYPRWVLWVFNSTLLDKKKLQSEKAGVLFYPVLHFGHFYVVLPKINDIQR